MLNHKQYVVSIFLVLSFCFMIALASGGQIAARDISQRDEVILKIILFIFNFIDFGQHINNLIYFRGWSVDVFYIYVMWNFIFSYLYTRFRYIISSITPCAPSSNCYN